MKTIMLILAIMSSETNELLQGAHSSDVFILSVHASFKTMRPRNHHNARIEVQLVNAKPSGW